MKKGFTLVELLAVVAILALIAMIAIPSALNFSKSIKKDMYCEKVETILNEAERWGNDHSGNLRDTCYIETTVRQLVEDGMLKKESNQAGKYIANPYKDNTYMDNLTVRIYLKYKNAVAYLVETDSELRNACSINVSPTVNRC